METFPSSHDIEELTEESKIDQNLEKKHILPLKKKHPIGDDINKLFEAIEIGSSRLNGIDRHLERRKHLSKRALKRPMRFGAPQVSGIGISEPVSLKQALRGLCISQASEMAAVKKRMSRTLSSSPGAVPETVAIDKLYRAVVIKSSEMGNLYKKGKMGFLEISLVPERSSLNVSERACESGNAFKGEVSEKNDAITEPEIKDDDIARVSAIVDSGEPEQIVTSELTACSSSGNKIEQRFPEMDDNSKKENRQIKNLASETVSLKTFNVENKLLMNSRRVLKRSRRSRTQNFVKNKIVPKTTPGPKSQIQHDQRAKSSHDYNFGKFFHESSESLRTNQSDEVDHTVEASAISKIMKTDLVTSNSNIDKHGNVEHLSNKTMNIMTKSLEKGEISQSSKSSNGDYSSTCTTNHSKESYLSGGSSNSGSRPHMSKNLRWEAIDHVKKEHGNLSLQHFKLMKKIGVGDIGTVYLSELIGTSCLFAVKVMDNEFLLNRNKSMRATTEKLILESLDHPFLPTLYAHFETKKFSCLVMDYCPGGDLHVLRQKQMLKCFPEKAVRFYVAEVLLAIEYLHMLGVVYRDLKPENILVREDGHIMLSDFDLSLMCSNVNPTLFHSTSPVLTKKTTSSISSCSNSSCIDPFCLQSSTLQLSCFTPRFLSKTRKLRSDLANQIIPLPQIVVEPTNARSNSFVGTHEYLAPEIIKGEGHGSSVDWWALGVFLYELLYGKTPFKGSNNEETISNVVSENLKFPQATPLVSSHARDLMRKLLTKEPENRLGSLKGAVEIKQHVFFEGLNWALIRCETPPDMTKLLDTSKSGKSQCENGCRRDEARFEMF